MVNMFNQHHIQFLVCQDQDITQGRPRSICCPQRDNYILLMFIPDVGCFCETPWHAVGDKAFPVKENTMRPYLESIFLQGGIFNYHLSRAGQIVETSFGILAARWYAFRRPLSAAPDKATNITQATVALYNYCEQQSVLRIVHHPWSTYRTVQE